MSSKKGVQINLRAMYVPTLSSQPIRRSGKRTGALVSPNWPLHDEGSCINSALSRLFGEAKLNRVSPMIFHAMGNPPTMPPAFLLVPIDWSGNGGRR